MLSKVRVSYTCEINISKKSWNNLPGILLSLIFLLRWNTKINYLGNVRYYTGNVWSSRERIKIFSMAAAACTARYKNYGKIILENVRMRRSYNQSAEKTVDNMIIFTSFYRDRNKKRFPVNFYYRHTSNFNFIDDDCLVFNFWYLQQYMAFVIIFWLY